MENIIEINVLVEAVSEISGESLTYKASTPTQNQVAYGETVAASIGELLCFFIDEGYMTITIKSIKYSMEWGERHNVSV